MNSVDLGKLATLTKDYAAFQARKSGLATALGGLIALLLLVVPMCLSLDFNRVFFRKLSAVELMLFAPLVWLMLKQILSRLLYQGFGEVKATPDIHAERHRWYWVFGISIFLMACLTAIIALFASGWFTLPRNQADLKLLEQAGLSGPWVIGLPLLYLVFAPWWIRGVEEARAYAVLVGLCMVWVWEILIFRYLPWQKGPEDVVVSASFAIGILLLVVSIIVWASLAMIRGWREHREYRALLQGLPPVDVS